MNLLSQKCDEGVAMNDGAKNKNKTAGFFSNFFRPAHENERTETKMTVWGS